MNKPLCSILGYLLIVVKCLNFFDVDGRLMSLTSKYQKFSSDLQPSGRRFSVVIAMFAVKAKIYGVIYNQSSSIAFDETFSYWSAPKKTPNFSAFHWSPNGSFGFYWPAFRNREGGVFTENDGNKLNHRIGPKRT